MADKSVLLASDYVHLHNHTHYSLLDGLSKVPNLIELTKNLGMKAVAITDHGTLSGVIEFYKSAQQQSIKPIIGMEAYVAARGLSEKEPSKDKTNYHLTILAMNQIGYKNLMRLSTIANLQGMYYKPRIDKPLLEKHSEGLIILSGCIGGEVGDNIRQGQYQKAKDIAIWYKKVFKDRYYLEVQDHGHPKHPRVWAEQQTVNEQILKLSQELDIPPVVTCDAHYLRHSDQTAHEILLCVQTGAFLNDEKRMSLSDIELHVTEPKEIIKRWGKTHPSVITNTKAIADRCNVTIKLGDILIPKFAIPKGETEQSYLQKLVLQGLINRYAPTKQNSIIKELTLEKARDLVPKKILDRAQFELSVINDMNFCGYFLIIADFVNWGKNQGIVFGPGRGSAAGSIIAYALKITELDPLKYDLLFERFLNPDRVSMPDIDIDIQDSRRDEVIQYCINKYGIDRVANIVTFGTMAARNAVRDVARVLQVPYIESDRLAKMIPPPVQGRHIPLANSVKDDFDLNNEYEHNETAHKVIDLAMQLEGTIRSHGVHAAGVVIAPDDIVNYVPLEMAQKGVVATQYSMGPIEELGLLKIDFLGLSNLTIIKNALRIIKKIYHQDVDINQIPLEDKATFQLLANGDTTGVFQLESSGMKRYLKELKPTNFEDIIAMNALYRPGPMQWIDEFIARKLGKRDIEYLHPKTKAALENTYGVLVYQEQVMQIAKDLCGFTGGQADTLRKGVAKKKPEVLAALKKDFIEGALKNSDISENKIEEFWRSLEAFAAYCFPKAHAACYATISYWTAYLKANYMPAFMAALMTSDYDDIDRLSIEISECQKHGIKVLPPDVNESFVEFSVVPGNTQQIRFGMKAIKNVGSSAVEEILQARQINGVFKNLEQFLSLINTRVVNRKTFESLIKAGALDSFGDRSSLLHNIDIILAFASRLHKAALNGQTDLFGNSIDDTAAQSHLKMDEPPQKYSPHQQLVWERELLGLYLSQHPLTLYENFLSEQTMPVVDLQSDMDGKSVIIGGTINEIKEISTKNGQKMAFIKIEDLTGEIEILLFPGAYQQTVGLWERDRVVLCRGKISSRDREGNISNEVKILVDDAREVTIEQAQSYQLKGKKLKLPTKKKSKAATLETNPQVKGEAKPVRVYIRLPNADDQDTLLSLKSTIDKHSGDTEVVLVLGPGQNKQIIKLTTKIDQQTAALEELQATVGADNVRIK